MADDKNTSIQVKLSIKKRLEDLGKKRDSYNDILKRLLDEHERQRGK